MILDLIALDDSARVWIYQASRELSYDELDDTREQLFPFLDNWTSHNSDLYTYGNVFHRRFLALFVDESKSASASGCSIDGSVHWVQKLGEKLNVDFFNRSEFSYMDTDEEIHLLSQSNLETALESNQISSDTLFFDHLVKTKGDFLTHWLKPLKSSWQSRFIKDKSLLQ